MRRAIKGSLVSADDEWRREQASEVDLRILHVKSERRRMIRSTFTLAVPLEGNVRSTTDEQIVEITPYLG